jgi:hypothetical protein
MMEIGLEGKFMSIGINVYALRVVDVAGEIKELHNVYNGNSIIDIIKAYINNNFGSYKDNDQKSNLYKFVDWQIVNIKNEQGDHYMTYLYGRMKSGAYGVETEIVNKATGITMHNQTEDEAGLIPFDFYVALPADECMQSVIIMQTQGIYGVKSVFSEGISTYLRSQSIPLGVHFGSLYPREYVERYLRDGVLKKMKIFRYNIPRDEADAYGINSGNKKVRQVITVSSSMGFAQSKLDQIRECISGRRHYSTLVEIGNMDFDDLRIEFDFGGKSKTISLKNLERVVVSEDITDKVITTGGHPTKESILPNLTETAKEYLSEMGVLLDIEDLQEELVEICQSGNRGDNDDEGYTGTNG